MTIILNGSTGITTPADTVTGNETVGGTLAVNGVSNALGTPGTSGNVMTSNGTAWVSSAPAGGGLPTATAIGQVPFSTDGSTYSATQKIVQATTQATTSGTSINFTGIPSWVKRVTVMFNGVSQNSASETFILQIGAGSVVTSGYSSANAYIAPSTGSGNVTSGFPVNRASSDPAAFSGNATICLLGSNLWSFSSVLADTTNGQIHFGAGSISLGGVLDRVRLTTVSGTATLDAGSINILYE